MTNKSKLAPSGTMIVVEGGDGSGKTTLAKLLRDRLEWAFPHVPVHYHRTPDAKVRDMLLNRTEIITAEAELLLYAAGHLIILENEIKPALARGEIVILDRYFYSTLAYQGYGRQNLAATKDLVRNYIKMKPDLVIFARTRLQNCQQRLQARGQLDFMDRESVEFHSRTYDGYENIRRQLELKDVEMVTNGIPRVVSIDNNNSETELRIAVNQLIDSWLKGDEATPQGIRDIVAAL